MAAQGKAQASGSLLDARDQVERAEAAAFLLDDLRAGSLSATLQKDPDTVEWLRDMAERTIIEALSDALATLNKATKTTGVAA